VLNHPFLLAGDGGVAILAPPPPLTRPRGFRFDAPVTKTGDGLIGSHSRVDSLRGFG
jgi:hypothetical protein